MKKNQFLILLILLMIPIIFSFFDYLSYYHRSVNSYQTTIVGCNNNKIETEYCDALTEPFIWDTYTLFFFVINQSYFRNVIPFLPLIIILFATQKIYNYYKSGFIQNKLLRDNYKKIKIQLLKETWKFALVLPIIFTISFILCFIVSRNFDIEKTNKYYPGRLYIDYEFTKNIGLFYLNYFINIFLNSIFWINLGILTIKKADKFIYSVLSSFIIYLLYSVMLETFLGNIFFNKILNLKGWYYYSLTGIIWSYEGIESLLILFAISLFIAALSSILVLIKFSKKESMMNAKL